jgi:steroid 5-alpha reductase family enzyme
MNLLIAFIISLGINILMFIPAYLWKTDKLTDVSYAVTFALLAIIGLIVGGISIPSIILVVAILTWSIRLGNYLLIRIHKMGRDKRFDEMRKSFWKFGRFWVLQGLTVWFVLIPSLLFLAKAPTELPWYAYARLVIWACGLSIEAVADIQKYRFINNSKNKGKWIDTGLWKYSRHPNYFGEIALWFGLYLFVFSNLSNIEALIGIIGPLYITLLISFVSGVPLLEKRADKKWGKNPEYIEYKRNTSILLPWFKKSI